MKKVEMATMITKAEYLKRYLSGEDAEQPKKKLKKRKKYGTSQSQLVYIFLLLITYRSQFSNTIAYKQVADHALAIMTEENCRRVGWVEPSLYSDQHSD